MRVPGARRVLRAAARVARRPWSGRRGVVLLYHRVGTLEPDPWDLCVSEDNFAQHLRVLQELGAVVPLRSLGAALEQQEKSPPVFVISFDDGYADNAERALPILRRHRMAATVFVVSGTIGSAREFWWDALERVFFTKAELPRRLGLECGGRDHGWDLGAAASLTEAELRRGATWRVDGDEPAGIRQKTFLELWELLVAQDSGERDALIQAVLDWAGLGGGDARPTHRILTERSLLAMASDDLIDVGAHTRSHPSLPDLSGSRRRDEILGGKMDLESLLGRPVTSFSYPFGRYTAKTSEIVREAGFAAACTTESLHVYRNSDPLALPRVYVRDWDGQTFRKTMATYL
jgi:peptidoglycan/xylan/chitin deacetylase (PgdA/CDA1 family)